MPLQPKLAEKLLQEIIGKEVYTSRIIKDADAFLSFVLWLKQGYHDTLADTLIKQVMKDSFLKNRVLSNDRDRGHVASDLKRWGYLELADAIRPASVPSYSFKRW